MKYTSFLLFFIFCCACEPAQNTTDSPQWEAMFNGKNLDGWIVKIAGHKAGENVNNTFRVEDGMVRVSYNDYESFEDLYGHMYTKRPYSYYRLRYDYRFIGEQIAGGESWNVRNSGIMVHSQSAESNEIGQHFPVSIEMQLLGGLGDVDRTTGNVCTPGTAVHLRNRVDYAHCISSDSKTYHGDQWVSAEIIVLGDSIIHQIIEGDTVLSYTKPIIGGGMIRRDTTFQEWKNFGVENYMVWESRAGEALGSGFIALQAESHPIDFKNVEIMDLSSSFSKGTNPQK